VRPGKPPRPLLLLLPLLRVEGRCQGTGRGSGEDCHPCLLKLSARPLERRAGWGKGGCWEGWGRRWWEEEEEEEEGEVLVGPWYVFKAGRKDGQEEGG